MAHTTSADMKVWKFCLIFMFLLLSSALGEDTAEEVAEDIGVHQLERLVELLTSKECEDLLFALSHPEENVFRHLERLSPEKNQLDLKPRAKRDTSTAADSEAQCRTALTDWLLRYGEQTYYDRLSRALQHIGRTDIAVEVGKNVNQDKVLSLKRFVEDYHKYVSSLNVPPVQSDTKDHQREGQRFRKRKVRDLTWRDLDLIVERAPVPLYQKGPLDVILPLLYGILLGFGGTLLAGVSVLLLIVHVHRRNQHSRQPRVTSSSSRKHTVGGVMLDDAASKRLNTRLFFGSSKMVELSLPVDVSEDEIEFSSEEENELMETLQGGTEREGENECEDEDSEGDRAVTGITSAR